VAIRASRIAVQVEPTLLTVGNESDATSGRSVILYNPGPETVYLGGSSVDVEAGFGGLVAGAVATFDLARGESLYGVVADGDTDDLHVLQSGV